MATAKKALSIQQYASIFAGLTVALLITFGALTYHEMQQVRSNLTESSLIAARKELVTNVSKAYSSARSTAASFAQWNEVLRQIQSPRNHETWRQHRLEHTDTLPKHVIDVDIYDTSGTVLVPAGKQTLPSSINTLNRNPTVEVYDRTPTLIVTHPVFSTHEQAKLLGYVAIRMQLLPLLTTQPYRFIESSSLAIGQPQEPHLDAPNLAARMQFSLRENPMAETVDSVLANALLRLAMVIAILALVFYPFMVYLVGKPLTMISRQIDRLRGDPHGSAAPEDDSFLPIAEVTKISQSLTDYHTRLLTMHSSLDEKTEELTKLVNHDALTGVMNRRAFDEHWRDMSRLLTDLRFGACLVLFDVVNFKAINDSYGHQVADGVLTAVASCINDELRRGEPLFRLGGDEFATVLMDCHRKNAIQIAERCQRAISAYPFNRLGMKEPVRVSISLAHTDNISQSSLQALQRQADVAMYYAKKPGCSRIAAFDQDMATNVKGMFSNWLNNAVFEAVSKGKGLTMFYQPVVDLKSGEVVYLEALLRIRYENEWISPTSILPVVEARRLETELDRAVFECIRTDLLANKIPSGSGISINVSGPTISNPHVVDWLSIFKPFMGKHRLILEITETALITQLRVARDLLGQLRDLGFEVALDDFGSGYSSVTYLASMPVDVVKFDISLIRLLNNPAQRGMILHLAHMIIDSGHSLVAEGIETETLLEKVRQAGFDFGQGYLFARPGEPSNVFGEPKIQQHA